MGGGSFALESELHSSSQSLEWRTIHESGRASPKLSSSIRDDPQTARSRALITMVDAFTTLAIFVAWIGVIFFEAGQQWGGPPSPSGSGVIL